MAIPLGTTSRQLHRIARWTLVWLMVLGPLAWWWVGYGSWGALTGGLLAVLGLWLMWRTVADDRSVPGHPFHLVLLGPAGILAWHFIRHGVLPEATFTGALAGALDLSILMHLALVAAAVMLTQSLLPGAARHVAVLATCGAAMMAGAAAAVAWQQTDQARNALALLGFAGVGVWLSLLWGLAPRPGPGPVPQALRRRDLRLGCIAVATAAAALFAQTAPRATVWAAVVVGAALVLAALCFARHRTLLLIVGGVLSVGGMTLLATLAGPVLGVDLSSATWFGCGEEAFGRLYAGSSGLALLVGTVGLIGCAWVVLGGAACTAWLLWQASRDGADQGRAVVWAAATGLAASAVLAAGGAFIPSASLAAAFTWGMLPAMLGRTPRPRHGAMLMVPVLTLMLLLGAAKSGGLIAWVSDALAWGDKVLHVVVGAVLAAVSAWLFGSKRWWAGLLAIAAAALLGGPGELVQEASAWRTADLADWAAHAIGSALVAIPYLLCIGARLCESPDAVSGIPSGRYR